MARSHFIAAVVLVLSLASWSMAGFAVLPQHSSIDGKSLGTLSGIWWQQVQETPMASNPLTDPTGAFGSSGKHGDAFFLYGTSSGTVNRTISVPAGSTLFFPVANYEIDNVGFNRAMTDAELTSVIHAYANITTSLFAKIDGQAVPNLFGHRETSSIFTFKASQNNINGDPAGTTSRAIADGYWLAVSGLSAGSHTLSFGGAFKGNLVLPAGVADSSSTPVTIPLSGSVATNYNLSVSTSSVPLPAAAWAALTVLPIFFYVGIRRSRT